MSHPTLAELAKQAAQRPAHGALASLHAQGEAALEGGLSWPHRKAEAWRHTQLEAWAARPWRQLGVLPQLQRDAERRHAEPPEAADAQLIADLLASGRITPRATGPILYFVDGRYVADASDAAASDGLFVLPLGEAEVREPSLLRALGTIARAQKEAFAALNGAMAPFGAVVSFAPSLVCEKSIELIFVNTSAADEAVHPPRLLVVCGPNARGIVTETHVHMGQGVPFNNAVSELWLGRGAKLAHGVVQDGSSEGLDLSHIAARVEADAELTLATLDTGAKLARRSVQVDLVGAGASCNLAHLSLAQATQHHDTQSAVRHVHGNTQTQQLFRAVVRERATSVFGGMIEVEKDAQKMSARQMSRGLVLDAGGQVLLRPQLIIGADDVRCSHGATVGQLDEDALFYLASRGFSQPLAKQLLTLAYLGEALSALPQALAQPLRHKCAIWLGIDPAAAAAVARED